jgi:hypothetical protein
MGGQWTRPDPDQRTALEVTYHARMELSLSSRICFVVAAETPGERQMMAGCGRKSRGKRREAGLARWWSAVDLQLHAHAPRNPASNHHTFLSRCHDHEYTTTTATTIMINAVLVFNNNGQPRLTKFYTQLVCRNVHHVLHPSICRIATNTFLRTQQYNNA